MLPDLRQEMMILGIITIATSSAVAGLIVMIGNGFIR